MLTAILVSTALKTSVSAMRVLLVKMVQHALMDQVLNTFVFVQKDLLEEDVKTLIYVIQSLAAMVGLALIAKTWHSTAAVSRDLREILVTLILMLVSQIPARMEAPVRIYLGLAWVSSAFVALASRVWTAVWI